MTKTDTPEELKSYDVTVDGKIYWNKRNRLGQFCTAYGKTRSDTIRAEWRDYVEAKLTECEAETSGKTLTDAAIRRGYTLERVLTGELSQRWVTQEVRDYVERNGHVLRLKAFLAQSFEQN